jgi:hypothetical protein
MNLARSAAIARSSKRSRGQACTDQDALQLPCRDDDYIRAHEPRRLPRHVLAYHQIHQRKEPVKQVVDMISIDYGRLASLMMA